MKHLILTMLLSACMIAGYTQDKPALTQCTEITNGVRCKRAAETGKEVCKLHDKDLPHCGDDIDGKPGGRTAKGLPCKHRVKVKGERCYQHQFQ